MLFFQMNTLHTLIKTIGFGLFSTAIQDNFLEKTPSIYNWVALSAGGAIWLTGTVLENYYRPADNKPISTHLIKESLHLSAGYGFVNSITHFSKRVDTTSANLGSLSAGFFLSTAVCNEVDSSEDLTLAPLKWEKMRFLLLVTADYFTSVGIRTLVNREHWNLLTIITFPIGVLSGILEWLYGRKNDEGLNLQHALNRRAIKLFGALNLIFAVRDFITGHIKEKYTMADDVYGTLVSALLFAVTVKLSKMATQPPLQLPLLNDAPATTANEPVIVEVIIGPEGTLAAPRRNP